MRRFLIFLFLFFSVIGNVDALEKEEVLFDSCVDGDTAKFIIDDEVKSVRFLAIDTPETVHPTKGEEPYGKEASDFTCNSLKKAKKILLEYEEGNKIDKYGRILAWVWIDDVLLQDELIKLGYAEVAYLYDDYKYTSLLKDHQAIAEANLLGIWNNEVHEEQTPIYVIILLIVIVVIIMMISPKYRRKIKNKIKRKIKSSLSWLLLFTIFF